MEPKSARKIIPTLAMKISSRDLNFNMSAFKMMLIPFPVFQSKLQIVVKQGNTKIQHKTGV